MHPIENILQTTMTEIKNMVDVNTIVGDAVTTPGGLTIIPVSKVSFAFVSGGGEYCTPSKSDKYAFSGGGSAGISVSPMVFLVVDKNDNVRIISAASKNTIDKLIESAPELLSEVKTLLGDCNKGGDANGEQV